MNVLYSHNIKIALKTGLKQLAITSQKVFCLRF